MKKIVITGGSGFVGQNLALALQTRTNSEIIVLDRNSALNKYRGIVVDHIIHLAGANVPAKKENYVSDNVDYAEEILKIFTARDEKSCFHYASTKRVNRDDLYGASKKAGETLVNTLAPKEGWRPIIWRLPNVFGKWCRPNYNSFVSTFIKQAISGQDLSVYNPMSQVELLYIDDLVDLYIEAISSNMFEAGALIEKFPTTSTTVGAVAELITRFFKEFNTTSLVSVSNKFEKQLHATFLSYLTQEDASFKLKRFESPTGAFCEVFKSIHLGQISVLTIEQNETRGNHYHHTKCENFYLSLGSVNLIERDVRGGEDKIRTINEGESFWTRPGWVHTIKNIGSTPAVLLIWANEIFDHDRPDTYRPDD